MMRQSFGRNALVRAAFVFSAFAALGLFACNPDAPNKNAGGRSARTEGVKFPPSQTQPVVNYAAGLQTTHAEVCGFVDQFLNTCLFGDYSGYRRLVSRRREPETKERFQAIYYAIRSVTIDGIQPQHVRDLPDPTYLVTATVTLDPEARVAVRGKRRQIAILAFQEDGQWRMAPAPSSLQPGHDEESVTTAPSSAPAYPWDAEGDY